MRYTFFPSLMWKVYRPHFSRQLETMFGYAATSQLMRRAKNEYRRILEGVPEFDKDDPMLINILNAALFIAIYKNIDTRPDLELLKEFYSNSMRASFITRLFFKRMNVFSEKYQNKLNADAQKSQKRENPFGWKFEFRKGDDINSFSAYYHTCGILRLTKKENVEAITPALCAFDYPMAEMMGARFYREQTLAGGGKYCDCHYSKIEIR